MKTALVTVMLAASFMGRAQRFFENTTGSWTQPDLSVETTAGRVVTGFTETNPSTGLLAPAFKITTLTGTPGNAFYVNFPDAVILMDFTIRPSSGTIILTGMTAVTNAVTPYKMFVAEVTMTGGFVQSFLEYTASGTSMIPHQVIQSPTSGQVVVVGTEITGFMTSANTFTIPKRGFVLGLDINNYNNILYTVETNTPTVGTDDADMLETVTEVPGTGYFIAGSANSPTSANEQDLAAIGVNYGGAVIHNNVYDNTSSRYAGASVMFNPATGTVFMLANNRSLQMFELVNCNATTGVALTPFYHYPITSLPASSVAVNGFRLQQTAANQIVVGGYIYCTSTTVLPNLLTPFQLLLPPALTSFINAKYFQSGNNSTPNPLYFDETGSSVYINTPDMIVYSSSSNKTYLVSQNSNMGGYDHDVASITNVTACETAYKVNVIANNVPVVGTMSIGGINMFAAAYVPSLPTRSMINNMLCTAVAPLAPFTGTLSPNPATSQLKVELQDVAIQQIVVIDLNGNQVMSTAPSGRSESATTIDVSKLTPGMYLIQVTDANGTAYRERFVKE